MNPGDFIENLNAWTPEQLVPYQGRYVAWSDDGKSVLAVGTSWAELYQEIERKALTQYVADYVPTPREIMEGNW